MTFRPLMPAIAWSVVSLVLTLIPGKELPEVDVVNVDKIVHVILFAPLMFLTAHGAIRGRLFNRDRSALWFSFLYCMLLGILIEVLQNFVPARNYSIIDVAANALGVVVGYFVYIVFRSRYK